MVKFFCSFKNKFFYQAFFRFLDEPWEQQSLFDVLLFDDDSFDEDKHYNKKQRDFAIYESLLEITNEESIRFFLRSKEIQKNIGYIIQLSDGVAVISGLRRVGYNEMVTFYPFYVLGMIVNLERGKVSAIIFASDSSVNRGFWSSRTHKVMSMVVGCVLLTRMFSPLGDFVDSISNDSLEDINLFVYSDVEVKAPSFIDRTPVRMPLVTGWKVIDSLIPIGRGQRELIIGDQKTGKTTIGVDAILGQRHVKPMVFCIYIAIGKRKKETVGVFNLLREFNSEAYTSILATSSDDPIALQYIAPYGGCAVSEYFRNQGGHSMVIYDDLSKHAAAYRQISLILRRPPGREAFPGDVFYLHSRLLERAAMLRDLCGKGSLTALPIVETVDGDLSAYIPTNLISITDGQIYLDKTLLESGVQPPIHRTLSVSRVGAAAQGKAYKRIVVSLKLILAQYKEVEGFEKFGAAVDKNTKRLVIRGKVIVKLLMQGKHQPLLLWQQIAMLYAGVKGFFDEVRIKWIMLYEEELLIFFRFFHLLGNLFLGMNYFFILFVFKRGNFFGLFLQQFLYEWILRIVFYGLLFSFFKPLVVLKDVSLGSFLNKDGRLVVLLTFY